MTGVRQEETRRRVKLMRTATAIPRWLSALLLPAIVLLAAGGCASLRPRENAMIHPEVLPERSRTEVLGRNGGAPLELPGRLHLVALEVVSEREVLLGYALQGDLDRVNGRARRLREVHGFDPRSGMTTRLAPDGAEARRLLEPRYRDFRDRTPEEISFFGGNVVIVPEEYERRYSFLLDASLPGRDDGEPPADRSADPLGVTLRASYGSRPDGLRVTFYPPSPASTSSGSGVRLEPRTERLRLTALDISGGVTPTLVRHLSAMRWDGRRYVTFFDSIFDLKTGERYQLVQGVPSTYLEVVSVDERWETAAIVHGELRITRDLGISPLHLP
jgi:hypothetical protein